MPNIDKDNYLCIGCGGCAFKCPKQCISMKRNYLGQYIPKIDYNTCIDCNLCEKNCPVYHGIDITREENYSDIVGNYLKCYMGYDEVMRSTSASGGFVTATLKTLLIKNVIDYAVCLKNTKVNDCFYQYIFINNHNDLVSCSRSAYYPIDMSEMLRYIQTNEGRYAVVVLPCQAKLIRTLQAKDPILRNRIVFLLGLVCGGMPGAAMVDYTALSLGIKPHNISQISFRDKNDKEYNRNYSINIENRGNKRYKSSIINDAFGFSFLNKLFHYRGCNICDDIFAEYADAVYMDAWLPEYYEDTLGTSICIIRNNELLNVINDYFIENPYCKEVTIDIPIKAQNSVGLIQRKKKQSYFKRNFYHHLGYMTPDNVKIKFTITEKLKFYIRSVQEYLIQNKSFTEWRKYKSGIIDFTEYDSRIHRFIKRIKKI